MEHLKGYDSWKTRAPDCTSGGVPMNRAFSHTRMLWFRSWRFMRRQSPETYRAWMDEQRQIPAFAGFVRWVDARAGDSNEVDAP